MSTKKGISDLTAAISNELAPAVDKTGKLDLELLRKSNASLADLLTIITESRTWRDRRLATAKDLATILLARDSSTKLGQAFEDFEKDLSIDLERIRRDS